MDLLPGVRSATVTTSRLRMHYLESGPSDGELVVLVHGNLSTGRFYEHVMPELPSRYRVIAPDMRGFGRTEHAPLDATRGLSDWADDLVALLDALGVDHPPHLVGWSTGGGAIARFSIEGNAAASLTLIDPVAPYGFGGTNPDGTPWYDDYSGSGAGMVNPTFLEHLAAGDRSTDSPFSPRNVMAPTFWGGDPLASSEHSDTLFEESMTTWVDENNFPGDVESSDNWPGYAPGTRGILNALSPKYLHWDEIVELENKPPIMWTHGAQDAVVSDNSTWDAAVLGAAGLVADWPGPNVCPAQPMVTQIRTVLGEYETRGGTVVHNWIDGAQHLPIIGAKDEWLSAFTTFLEQR
ncbi:alpha/beta hydrolase [Rhodococcus ruber]|uniref:Alpha/beta hydrolase n=1 Tax=Rhodococcus ruber TaxID=1830 RepID=A0ABT4M821_9NOCA|nr:alpha/beta hydrolase [Rhodococcus ruber]MCZ4516904.1 alpha/beta hydrolase [Rhodococcus ruber]